MARSKVDILDRNLSARKVIMSIVWPCLIEEIMMILMPCSTSLFISE